VQEALDCLPAAVAHHWCAADVPRAMPVETLSGMAFEAGRSGTSHASVAEAVRAAVAQRRGDEMVVVLGSVFTVGEALTELDA